MSAVRVRTNINRIRIPPTVCYLLTFAYSKLSKSHAVFRAHISTFRHDKQPARFRNNTNTPSEYIVTRVTRRGTAFLTAVVNVILQTFQNETIENDSRALRDSRFRKRLAASRR